MHARYDALLLCVILENVPLFIRGTLDLSQHQGCGVRGKISDSTQKPPTPQPCSQLFESVNNISVDILKEHAHKSWCGSRCKLLYA